MTPYPSADGQWDLLPGLVVKLSPLAGADPITTVISTKVKGDYMDPGGSGGIYGVETTDEVDYYRGTHTITVHHPGYDVFAAVKADYKDWATRAVKINYSDRKAMLSLTQETFTDFPVVDDKATDKLVEDIRKFDYAAELFFSGEFGMLFNAKDNELTHAAKVTNSSQSVAVESYNTVEMDLAATEDV
jgi:hypothetical protein